MPALQIIESEEAVMDQGAGSSSCQPVTFPRLGRQPVLFKDEALHVPIDKPPWSVNHKGSDRFKCPGCGQAVAWRIHGLAWRPTYSRTNISAPAREPCFARPSFAGSFRLCRRLPRRHDGLGHGDSDLAPFL